MSEDLEIHTDLDTLDEEIGFDGDQADSLEDGYFSAKLGHRRLRDQIYQRNKGNTVQRPHWKLVIESLNTPVHISMKVVPLSALAHNLLSVQHHNSTESKHELEFKRQVIVLTLCLFIAHSSSSWAKRIRLLIKDFYRHDQKHPKVVGATEFATRLAMLSPFPKITKNGDLANELNELFQDDFKEFHDLDFKEVANIRTLYRDLIIPFLKYDLIPKNLYPTETIESYITEISNYSLINTPWKQVTEYLNSSTLVLPNQALVSTNLFVNFSRDYEKYMGHQLSIRSYLGGALAQVKDETIRGILPKHAQPIVQTVKQVFGLSDHFKYYKRTESRESIIKGFKR